MNAPDPVSTTQQRASNTRVTVAPKDTVGALDPSMPPVASTPYLVTIAEFACAQLVKDQLNPAKSPSERASSSIIWERARSAQNC